MLNYTILNIYLVVRKESFLNSDFVCCMNDILYEIYEISYF